MRRRRDLGIHILSPLNCADFADDQAMTDAALDAIGLLGTAVAVPIVAAEILTGQPVSPGPTLANYDPVYSRFSRDAQAS